MSRSRRPESSRLAARRRLDAARWWQRARRLFSQSLSEHPVFALQEQPDAPTPAGAVPLNELRETERGPLFGQHLRRMFQVRLRLTSAVGFLFLPAFTAFYFLIFPQTSRLVIAVCVLGMLVTLLSVALTFAVKTLEAARALSLSSFGLFTLCCAWVIPIVSVESALETEAGRAVQMVAVAAFIHILITALLLPLRLREVMGLSAFIVGALGVGIRVSPLSLQNRTTQAELFMVGMVAVLVSLLSHFNSRLRRRVFDASFDMALQTARMKAMSQTDALTGGYNRHHIETMLETELARAARFGRPLSLLMFDLDNFKIVNDTLGHGAGDQVLQAIHQIAGAELREIDTLARFGGDEFLILLPETDERFARRIAGRLHNRVGWELPTRFGAETLPGKVSLSVGVLTLEAGHHLPMGAILARVDGLLYDAKGGGKNQVVVGVER